MTTKPVLNVEKYAALYKAVEEFFKISGINQDFVSPPNYTFRYHYTFTQLVRELDTVIKAFKECTE